MRCRSFQSNLPRRANPGAGRGSPGEPIRGPPLAISLARTAPVVELLTPAGTSTLVLLEEGGGPLDPDLGVWWPPGGVPPTHRPAREKSSVA